VIFVWLEKNSDKQPNQALCDIRKLSVVMKKRIAFARYCFEQKLFFLQSNANVCQNGYNQ